MDDFEQFYGATQRRVLRSLVAVANTQDAMDCVQEAYIRAAARWRKVRLLDNPEAWVRRVAMNLAYDGHRKAKVRLRAAQQQSGAAALTSTPGPDPHVMDVVRAVRTLPRAQQEVVVLHHVLDLPVADVARELDRSENTVKTQLARARARLAELLSDQDQVVSHD